MVVRNKENPTCCSNNENAEIGTVPSVIVHPDAIIYIDPSICIACSLCMEICPFGLPIPDAIGKFCISRVDLCTECSACKRNCPVGAIIMQEQEGCGCLWDVRRRQKEQSCCEGKK